MRTHHLHAHHIANNIKLTWRHSEKVSYLHFVSPPTNRPTDQPIHPHYGNTGSAFYAQIFYRELFSSYLWSFEFQARWILTQFQRIQIDREKEGERDRRVQTMLFKTDNTLSFTRHNKTIGKITFHKLNKLFKNFRMGDVLARAQVND